MDNKPLSDGSQVRISDEQLDELIIKYNYKGDQLLLKAVAQAKAYNQAQAKLEDSEKRNKYLYLENEEFRKLQGGCFYCAQVHKAKEHVITELQAANAEIQRLQGMLAAAVDINKEIWQELYGQGLQVSGWHLNGELEPLDSWFEQNNWSLDDLQATTTQYLEEVRRAERELIIKELQLLHDGLCWIDERNDPEGRGEKAGLRHAISTVKALHGTSRPQEEQPEPVQKEGEL